MNIAINLPVHPETSFNFRSLVSKLGAGLRRAIELSAAPYMVMGSRYL